MTPTSFIVGHYPDEVAGTIETSSGDTLELRAIRRSDAANLVAFHALLSPDSIYRRYFSEHATLSDDEVAHFTHVDYVHRLALVIFDGDELVAVGRFDQYPGTTLAEVAFVVRDDYQHLGLGHQLLDHLADAAWARGVTAFSAETLFTNVAMISVFRHSGYPVTSSTSMGVVSLYFPIRPTESSVALRETHRSVAV